MSRDTLTGQSGAPRRLPAAGTHVTVCEVWPRDGIQSWPVPIATADKARVIDAIVAAHMPEIDVTSFVSPKLVPQLADSAELLASIDRAVRIRVLTVNMPGVSRVIAAHRSARRIDRCGMPFSASEAHNLANLRRNHADHRLAVEEMVAALADAGIAPLLGVATAFGCPIAGEVPAARVLDIVAWAHAIGMRAIMLGDTTGMAHPGQVANLFATLSAAYPDVDLVAHFHDNRGAGIVNALAAIGAGATTVDACLGGLGGEPSGVDQGIVGDQGNVVTEDLVAVLDNMGVATGIDRQALLAAGRVAEAVIGRPLLSKVQRATGGSG